LAPVDEARAERLVLQAAKVIYGGFDNWEVRGIRNLRLGVPLGGLTVDVVTVSDDGEILVLEGVWDGALWIDRVVQESREDAKKGGKGGKRQPRKEKPKCTKGRVCGMTCIRREKANGEATRCRFDPPPLVEQALNTASSMGVSNTGGGGAGGGQGYPTSLPKDHVVTAGGRVTVSTLDAGLNAIRTEGAGERAGMFRAFVERNAIQAVFHDRSASLDDHRSSVNAGLIDQSFVASGRMTLRGETEADPHAAGYTNAYYRHVVVTADAGNRTGAFKVDGQRLEAQSANILATAGMGDDVLEATTSRVFDRDTREFITYLHEVGHQVYFKAGLPSVPTDIAGSTTNYGSENEHEWFAEHFALWMMDSNGYGQLDPVGADFIRATLEQGTTNPVSIKELEARGKS
jgi:hypothetical protein